MGPWDFGIFHFPDKPIYLNQTFVALWFLEIITSAWGGYAVQAPQPESGSQPWCLRSLDEIHGWFEWGKHGIAIGSTSWNILKHDKTIKTIKTTHKNLRLNGDREIGHTKVSEVLGQGAAGCENDSQTLVPNPPALRRLLRKRQELKHVWPGFVCRISHSFAPFLWLALPFCAYELFWRSFTFNSLFGAGCVLFWLPS